MSETKLDAIDKKILQILMRSARTPIKDIAKEVYLSSPAVSSRIEKMERTGMITGYHATIDPFQFGYNIKAFVNLELPPDMKKDFYPYIESVPNVIECNCVTGQYSMLIEVFFETTQELDVFVTELQRFGKTQTQIVFCTSVEHRDVPIN